MQVIERSDLAERIADIKHSREQVEAFILTLDIHPEAPAYPAWAEVVGLLARMDAGLDDLSCFVTEGS